MVHCMKGAALILTDSGGVQEEAPSLGVPVLVMREETERPEAVEAAMARLVGTDEEQIVAEATAALEAPGGKAAWYQPGLNPFGDGKAGARIADWLAGSRTFPE
jgi:UDP-N-acetylglucosamine 2-epimerase (non-hydrolysing)